MHISKIELENIKSHAASTYNFSRGTTAITGENGAGKTTIIEAIAWALFDLLEYKKEDFVRRGAKKGSVTVTFESGLDEREYVVYRDTGSGYHVTDPRLQTRIADKKEEVFRFLWQHLGLEPGTDLRSLFRQAIGVPQGTFTAIFLEGATERKIAFDRLLKVEEYRQAAEKLRETSRFLDTGIAGIREDVARAEGELARSETVAAEYKLYQDQAKQLAAEIESLERDIADRRDLVARLDEAEKIETAVEMILADQKRVNESLANVHRAKIEIETLRPTTLDQERLEKEIVELREKIAHARAIENQIKSLDSRIERLRESYRTNALQLKDAEARAKDAGEVGSLEKRDAELVREIAGLRARLESDEKFQNEIKGGFCPILSQKCLNLAPGQTLEDFVSSQFTDLKTRIEAREKEQTTVTGALKNAREAERYSSMLATLREREAELAAEGKHLAGEKAELATGAAILDDLEKQFAAADARHRALGDPRSRIRFLESETAREPEMSKKLTGIERDLERLETDRRVLFEQLIGRPGWADDNRKYDRVRHAAERSGLHESEKQHAERRATYEAAKGREDQLAAEIKRFGEVQRSLRQDAREKERLEQVAEATAFIRDTLKVAAPIVAKNYIRHVSIEANQMFREITGNAEQTLEWAEDYSIVLEEDDFKRPFASFSGGEQMAAALAIRLALLKQLTDIRIAFFDEPTTNMDAERRENLAIQISRITNFDQLFVISHDDTFEDHVDNTVRINKTK